MLTIHSGKLYNDISAEAYSESSQTSKMEINANIVNGLKPLTIAAKVCILDV